MNSDAESDAESDVDASAVGEAQETTTRLSWSLVLPVVLLLALQVLPLVTGARTLYYRDTLRSHLPLAESRAAALADFEIPLVDPHRSNGQPLAGNPNYLAFYPTSWLTLVAPVLWAHNAHFWIHWLLAPWALFWLGRRLALPPPAAWTAATVYATSGFFLSTLNLANLVTGAALLPAFLAAVLALAARERPRSWHLPLCALLWALLVVSGEPLYAVAGAALAAVLLWLRGAFRTGSLALVALAVLVGTVVAAPLWVELLRIVPDSFRGKESFALEVALAQSWNPWTAFEWLLPLVFGPVDVTFWGLRFYGGNPPLLSSLHPGWLALALVAAGSLWRGAARDHRVLWSWIAIAVGAFCALGFHNPLLVWLHRSAGLVPIRYPIKLWVLVALGGSVLAGVGAERLLRSSRRGARRCVAWTLTTGAALAACAAFFLAAVPEAARGFLLGLEPRLGPAADPERLRLLSTAGSTVLTCLLLLAAVHFLRAPHPRRWALPLLLTVHAGSQLLVLASLYDTDDALPYAQPSPVLAAVRDAEEALRSAGAMADGEPLRVAHGGVESPFGPVEGSYLRTYPDARHLWVVRTTAYELYPFTGVAYGLRYAFAPSPEALDDHGSIATLFALPALDDAGRVAILEGVGVDILLLPRALDQAVVRAGRATLRSTLPSAGHELRVYSLERSAPEAWIDAEHPSEVQIDDRSAESWTVDVTTEAPGSARLVVQQTWSSLWRARVDGQPGATRAVTADGKGSQVTLLGVDLPAGRHRVELFVDRAPTTTARVASVLALLLLPFLGRMTGSAHEPPT